jgi:hypothetical protein
MWLRRCGLPSLVALTLSCSSSENPVEPAPPELRIVSGAFASDTVEAILTPLLIFEVGTAEGPSPGRALQFEQIGASASATTPSLQVSKIGENDFRSSTSVTTDAQGRAGVRVRLGGVARDAFVRVTCLACNQVDTVRFGVRAGNAVRLIATARDTSVVIGDNYRVGGTTFDRFGNPRVDHLTFESASPLVAVDTSGMVQVGPDTGIGTIVVHAGPLADSARFVVATGPTLTAIIASGSAIGDSATWIVTTTLNGLRQRNLTISGGEPAYPVPSPTADQVAYERADNGMQVYLIEGSGQKRRLIPPGQLIETRLPRFARDGQTIYFTGRTSATYGIWRVGVDGTGLTMITPTESGFRAPAPSPDGTRVAYSRDDSMVVRVMGSGKELALGPAGEFPVFSPDGARVAWLTNKGDVIVAMADGSSLKHFIPSINGGAGTNSGLTWLPTGDRLVARGWNGVLTVNATTGVQTSMPKLWPYYQLFARP